MELKFAYPYYWVSEKQFKWTVYYFINFKLRDTVDFESFSDVMKSIFNYMFFNQQEISK